MKPNPSPIPGERGNLAVNPVPEIVIALVLILVLFLLLPREGAAQPIWSANILNAAEGAYDEPRAKADFGPFIQYVNVPAGRARIKTDSESGRKVLEVKYPKGCVGPAECAMQVRAAFPARESAWMRYRIRFESGFDWNKGGKLPGLCGGQCNTGCESVSGRDGWSARMMWHAGGKMVQYLYYPDKTNSCGEDMAWTGVTLATGRWYEILNQVILNTPSASGGTGKNDGIMRAWLDGELVLEKKDLRFRDVAAVRLDAFYFSTFHGGDDASWAPDHDSFASFSDLGVTATDPRIVTSLSAPGHPIGRKDIVAAPLAAMEGSLLHVRNPGNGPLHMRLLDMRGKEVAVFDAPGGGEFRYRPGLKPGLYMLGWTLPQRSGSFRLPIL